MANHIFALVTIMLMAGVFGGLLNFYMQSQADTDSTSMPRSLIGGLAGAFVVPLVLFLVSSDLVVASQGDPSGMSICRARSPQPQPPNLQNISSPHHSSSIGSSEVASSDCW